MMLYIIAILGLVSILYFGYRIALRLTHNKQIHDALVINPSHSMDGMWKTVFDFNIYVAGPRWMRDIDELEFEAIIIPLLKVVQGRQLKAVVRWWVSRYFKVRKHYFTPPEGMEY